MTRAIGSGKHEIQLTVNGAPAKLSVHPMERLLDVLRRDLGLTGAKVGGACAVLLDGELVNTCLVPVAQAAGAKVTTVEGIAHDARLHPLQKSFLACNGAQCGICTPGMTLAAVHLLNKNPHPSLDEIREGLSGNLCRCTGYMQIFEAVSLVASSDWRR